MNICFAESYQTFFSSQVFLDQRAHRETALKGTPDQEGTAETLGTALLEIEATQGILAILGFLGLDPKIRLHPQPHLVGLGALLPDLLLFLSPHALLSHVIPHATLTHVLSVTGVLLGTQDYSMGTQVNRSCTQVNSTGTQVNRPATHNSTGTMVAKVM